MCKVQHTLGLVESELGGGANYGGPTLCPSFSQLIQGGGGVIRGYLKLIPDSTDLSMLDFAHFWLGGWPHNSDY